jgi:hypothetical protein
MDAQSILERFGKLTNWNFKEMLEVACEYIDNQQANDAFADFVSEAADNHGFRAPETGDLVNVPEPDESNTLDTWPEEFVGRLFNDHALCQGDETPVLVKSKAGEIFTIAYKRLSLATEG